MPPTSAPFPLGEHRASVLEYLRGVALSARSVARSIIEEYRPPADRRVLLRPSLVLWAGSACGGDLRDALPVAAALDLLDRFMLLHDELVDAPVRSNSESPVARWGLGQSLNAGDALYALALRSLAQDVVDPHRRLAAASLVTRAVLEAIEGRTSDIEANALGRGQGLLARVRSVRRRSATLTGAALEVGALLAGAPAAVRQPFNRAGRLLDVAGTSADPLLARRLTAKAVATVARCIPDRRQLPIFEEVAGYVAARAA
ncbi:MAG TPA: polyprenyl synthetase family protein [Candidatus Tumulicola sp.]|jgi:geranylgeranyl diphosphate synthase type I